MQTHIFHPLCLLLSNTSRLVLDRFDTKYMKGKISSFRKGDVVILFVILLTAGICYILMEQQQEFGEVVRLTANGKTLCYSLSEDQTIELTDGSMDYNIIVIKEHLVFMERASCRDQICVHHKAISKKNESIICLPNEVYIEVISGEDNIIDN